LSKQSVIAVSSIYGLAGLTIATGFKIFTIRKIIDNLPIAGKNTKGSLFPHSGVNAFSKNFLKRKVKIIVVSVTKKRYKFIKPDRILSAENIKLSALKI
jgi:hypothetical protein